MSVKDLYRAFVEGKRVKGKRKIFSPDTAKELNIKPYYEGKVKSVVFSKDDNGDVICRGMIEGNSHWGGASFLVEEIFLIDGA